MITNQTDNTYIAIVIIIVSPCVSIHLGCNFDTFFRLCNTILQNFTVFGKLKSHAITLAYI